MTTFENKVFILSDFWINYRNDQEFQDFFDYCDIGLPLAYAVYNELVKPLDSAIKLIDETWYLLLQALDVDSFYADQIEIADLDELFKQSDNYQELEN